jgi:hypothetical protein
MNMNLSEQDQVNQREKLLYFVEKMRQIQEIREHSPPYQASPSPPDFRPHYDQPLDYSASKKMKTEWDKHDSLGSDGNSDLSINHSPRSNDIESPRDDQTDVSPTLPPLPRLSISPPVSPIDSKEGILDSSLPNPLHRPLPALCHQGGQDMNGLLKLAGIATQLPHMHPSLPLSLPYMPSKHGAFPPPLSTSSPLPLYHPSLPHQESMSELAKIAVNSSQKYADFREGMMRNIESTKPKPRRPETSLSPSPSLSLTSTPPSDTSRGEKDDAYWERRRKNNEAAKRSRDARRLKENEIAMRASYLEHENGQLKMEVVQLRAELGLQEKAISRLRPPVN